MAQKWGSYLLDGVRALFGALIWHEERGVFAPLKGIDGNALVLDPPLASIVEVSGSDTYVCEAPAGTAASDAAWRCQKISVSGGVTTITWADSGRFSQAAANRTALTYA